MTGSFTSPDQNPQTARSIADLAVWIDAKQAVSVEGNTNPPLSPDDRACEHRAPNERAGGPRWLQVGDGRGVPGGGGRQ